MILWRKDERTERQRFGRINHVVVKVPRMLITVVGKLAMNKGREVDGKVGRNGCLQPWALEKKLIEGSNKGQ